MGELNLVIGPMYSGKSTELLRIYNKYKIKYNILVINHISDNRYGENNIYTHNKDSINCISFLNLFEFYNYYNHKEIEKFDVILIDEGQFFNDLYGFCKDVVEIEKKIVYVFGLSGDFKRNIFGEILYLMPIADNIKHLKSICYNCTDLKEAPFTMRKNSNTEQVLVGGEEDYIAVCRECWLKQIN
jgi:thymidine kinase